MAAYGRKQPLISLSSWRPERPLLGKADVRRERAATLCTVRISYNLRSVSEANRLGLQFVRSELCPIPQNSRSTARVAFDCLKNDPVTSQVVLSQCMTCWLLMRACYAPKTGRSDARIRGIVKGWL